MATVPGHDAGTHTLAVLEAALRGSFESDVPGAPVGLPVGVPGLFTVMVLAVPLIVMVVGPWYTHPLLAASVCSKLSSVGTGSTGTPLVHVPEALSLTWVPEG